MIAASPIIHVVDDDPSFRTAIGDLLSVSGYRVALYDSAIRLLKALPLRSEAGCILLDVQMAEVSGPQLQTRLAELGCKLPVVFITGHADIATSVQTIKAGAEDYLAKPVRRKQMLEVIERALVRYAKMRELDDQVDVMRSRLALLTPRENDVFALLVRGKPHKQLAYELGMAERTVKMHRHSIMDKFQVRSLAELAVIAERLDLLREPGKAEPDPTHS